MESVSPIVSVIIPVYNTEDFIAEAIDSVLAQTLEGSIEIIAVDDGSTDGSLKVLESYGDRIRVISKANAGQGAARNDALDVASGRFVYFMDSDDLIVQDTLRLCVEKCESDNLDFVFFDAESFGIAQVSESPWFEYKRGADFPDVVSGPEAMDRMLRDGKYRCSVCMSLFRRSFIEDNSLRFIERVHHEDELFSSEAYFKARRVEGLPLALYRRRLRENSTMTACYSEKNVKGYLTVSEKLAGMPLDDFCDSLRRKLISNYMLTLMQNAWNLPLGVRLRIASVILCKYPYAASGYYLLSLLCKKWKMFFKRERLS